MPINTGDDVQEGFLLEKSKKRKRERQKERESDTWMLRQKRPFWLGVFMPYLYARARVLSTQAAGQSPAAGGDVGHLGNGLHLLWAAYTHLQGTCKQGRNCEHQVQGALRYQPEISRILFICWKQIILQVTVAVISLILVLKVTREDHY